MMERRKIYFESLSHQQKFPECMTAVGKGLRQTWGFFNEKRKKQINSLKKSCPKWQQLALNEVKLAWHCRKLRLLQENVIDLQAIIASEINGYSAKEINWMRKIQRTLKKSVSYQEDVYYKLWQQINKDAKGM